MEASRTEFLRWSLTDPQYVPTDIMSVGYDILNSEDLSNRVYEIYLTFCAKSFTAWHKSLDVTIEDFAAPLQGGLYMPCVKRDFIVGEFDTRNDVLPSYACIVNAPTHDKTLNIEVARQIKRFPRRIAPIVPGLRYKSVAMWRMDDEERNRVTRRQKIDREELTALDGYFTVTPAGKIVHALDERARDHGARWNAVQVMQSGIALSVYCDRRFLWQVVANEPLFGENRVPLTLGVDAEHVKSLFYARSLPVTETGRKRPILHWVRAHERRLASGIDIDIRKHLRGITGFEMDSVTYEIVSPVKG